MINCLTVLLVRGYFARYLSNHRVGLRQKSFTDTVFVTVRNRVSTLSRPGFDSSLNKFLRRLFVICRQRFFPCLQLARCKVSSKNNNAEIRILDAGRTIDLIFDITMILYVQCSGSFCDWCNVYSRTNGTFVLRVLAFEFNECLYLISIRFSSCHDGNSRPLFSNRKIYFRQYSSNRPHACLSTCL